MGLKDRRLGKFYITFNAIETDHDYVYQVMGKVIVIRAEALLYSNMIEYVAISKYFDEVKEGYMMPEYKAVIHSEEGFLRFDKC